MTHRDCVHAMRLLRRFFDLLASGRKTVEVRVNDLRRKNIRPGCLIRFRCDDEQVTTRVTRVVKYPDFDTLLNHERPAAIDPTAAPHEIRRTLGTFYDEDRESLGTLAIEVELRRS